MPSEMDLGESDGFHMIVGSWIFIWPVDMDQDFVEERNLGLRSQVSSSKYYFIFFTFSAATSL